MAPDFDDFLESRRRAAATAFVRGDASAVLAISAPSGQVTFFDPGGGFTEGAEAVNSANERGASRFGPNGRTELEWKDKGQSGDLAFWTGYQRAEVELDGRRVPMDIRVTEVFRLLDVEWKMVHRHASMAKDAE